MGRLSKKWFRIAVPAFAALLIAACAGTPKAPADGNGDGDAGRFPTSQPGETYLNGQLVLREVTGPAEDGTTSFVVENTSGEDLEDVTVSIRFYMPPEEGIQERDVEVADQNVNFYAGDRVNISAVPNRPADVRGVELFIEPLTTVADPMYGTEYLEGSLQCVDMESDLTGAKPSVSFTVKNTSDAAIESPQFRVVFRLQGKVVAETDWASADGSIPPGGTMTLTPDLSGVGKDLGGTNAVLQIQKFVL